MKYHMDKSEGMKSKVKMMLINKLPQCLGWHWLVCHFSLIIIPDCRLIQMIPYCLRLVQNYFSIHAYSLFTLTVSGIQETKRSKTVTTVSLCKPHGRASWEDCVLPMKHSNEFLHSSLYKLVSKVINIVNFMINCFIYNRSLSTELETSPGLLILIMTLWIIEGILENRKFSQFTS
jgi:hypothetical protein